MSSFEISTPLSQPSLFESSIASLNSDLALYSTQDLQDPLIAIISPRGSSSSEPVLINSLEHGIVSTPGVPLLTGSIAFTVTSTADIVNPNDGVLTLREAIAQANMFAGADAINFDLPDGPQIITLTSGELKITDNLTIHGLGANRLTISGNNISRVFNVDNSSDSTQIQVAIEGLTIADGKASEGAGIYNRERLTVSHSAISGNSASFAGGGIYNSGSLTVSNGTLSGNSTTIFGGGIKSDGALTVSNSILSHNSAYYGGGIDSGNTLIVSNSTLSHNSATYGGGINSDGTGILTVSDSTLTHNSASYDGGGILNRSTVTVSNSTLSHNSAGSGGGIQNSGTLTVSNSTLSDNSAFFDGGGITNNNILTVRSSTLSGNSVSYDGGGLFNRGTVTMSNSTLSGNSASYDGGGIANGGMLTMSNSTLSSNSATSGGGIFNSGYGSLAVSNSIVGGNTASGKANEVTNRGSFTSNGYNLVGQNDNAGGFITTTTDIVLQGGIETAIAPLANNGSSTLTHALTTGSAAINTGDPTVVSTTDQRGVFQVGRRDIGAYESLPNVTVDTLIDEDNGNLSPGDTSLREAIARVSSGGSIYFSNALSGGTVQLTLGELLINKSLTIQGLGADQLAISGNSTSRVFKVDDGVDSSQIQVAINGLTITDGRAMDGFSTTGGGVNQGAGIYNRERLTVSHSILSSNLAYFGSGIYNDGDLTVKNSTLSGNSAYYEGGGISNYGTLTVSNSTLSGNSANSAGGGISNYYGTLTVINSTLSGNSVAYEGGGIYSYSSAVTVINSTLSGNSATTGGGISNSAGTLTVSSSTLSGNSAATGGGIYNYATLRVGNSIISGNVASETNAELGNYGNFISNGYNLVGQNGNTGGFVTTTTDIVLQHGIETAIAPLANNGGSTLTHALVAGSLALNAGNNALIPVEITTDQRGAVSRILKGRVDIGAFESSLQPLPQLTASDVTLAEGDNGSTIATFIVNLNAAANQLILVDYTTMDGTATAGSDYIATSGTLAFKPGETSKTISVVINSDMIAESDETFFLTLHDPINVGLAVNQVVARILNDDAPIILLEGSNGNDTLTGDNFANIINGRAGHDIIEGLSGNDTLSGGSGHDVVYGGDGNDIINGNAENDTIYGNNGSDQINGGSDDDVIIGGAGADTLTGGTGNDRYVYSALNEAGDTITDFINGSDILDLRELFRTLNYQGNAPISDGYLRLARVGGSTQIQIDAKNGAGFITLVTLNGVIPDWLVIGQTLLI